MIKKLYDAVEKLPSDKIKRIIRATDEIKGLSKTQILALNKTVKLSKDGSFDMYAYEISYPIYALFTFKSKRELILLDIMEITDDNTLKFLAFAEKFTTKNSEMTANNKQ